MKRIIFIFRHNILLLLVCTVTPFWASAQSRTQQREKLKARMSLSFTHDSNDNKFVDVKISHRENKTTYYGLNEEVELYINEIDNRNLIAQGKTNESGRVRFPLSTGFSTISDTSFSYSFIAVLPKSENYLYKEAKLAIQEAVLEVELYEEDSTAYVKAQLSIPTDSTSLFVEDAELKFYVQRSFSLLPFGGDYTYTDSEGTVVVEFPRDLPGDENGSVEIVVQLLEHEDFGTLERRNQSNWGVPLEIDLSSMDHKLWSNQKNAPLSLVIISLLIIGGIWGTLGYLILRLVKIKKLEK